MSSGGSRRASCRGVVFQFNHDAILFEFQEGDDEAIGVVKPHNVVVTSRGRRIPFSAKRTEDIARFIHIGDELECSVTKNTDLKKFIYTEDEEEVLEDGEVKKSSHQVSIQPEWFANEAKLIGRSSKSEEFDMDEIGEIEGEQVDDDIQVIEEVKKAPKPPQISTKPSPSKATVGKGETARNSSAKQSTGTKPAANKAGSSSSSNKQKSPEKEPLHLAKVLQLKRNTNKLPREKTKVVTGFLQFSEGKYGGRQTTFSNHNMYIWGHHLHQADLLYHIKAGDEFNVEVTENEKTNSIAIKRGFMGTLTTDKVDPANSKEFANWLASRSLDYATFLKWTADKLDRKPFFPLAAERLEGELAGMFRDPISGQVVGVLKIRSSGGPLEGKYVVFDGEDLYLHEVHVGEADIRLFLRVGDLLFCQVQDITSTEKRRFKKIIAADSWEFNQVAHLVYLGSTRPRSASTKPYESSELKTFLESIGRTLEEFDALRTSAGKKKPANEITFSAGDPSLTVPAANYNYFTFAPPPHAGSINHTMMASTLTAKAMMLSSFDDPLIHELLVTQEDVQIAAYLAKVFTQALVMKMQTQLRSQLQVEFGPNVKAVLETQANQITAAESALARALQQHQKQKDPVLSAVQEHSVKKLQTQAALEKEQTKHLKYDNSKAIAMTKRLAEVEAKAKAKVAAEEAAARQISKNKMREDSSKKMKKMLESFKASKNPVGKTRSRTPPKRRSRSPPKRRSRSPPKRRSRSPPKRRSRSPPVSSKNLDVTKQQSEAQFELEMPPIKLLRLYRIQNRPVLEEGDRLVFAHVSYPKNTRTNFKMSRNLDLEPEYYTLHSIHYFLENMSLEFGQYIRRAFADNVAAVRHPDRDNLVAYMTGASAHVPNLTAASHRELNPELFGEAVAVEEDLGEYGRSETSSSRSKDQRYGGSSRIRFDKPPSVVAKWARDDNSRSRSPPPSRRQGESSDRRYSQQRQESADYDPLNPTESPPPSPKRAPPPPKSRWGVDNGGLQPDQTWRADSQFDKMSSGMQQQPAARLSLEQHVQHAAGGASWLESTPAIHHLDQTVSKQQQQHLEGSRTSRYAAAAAAPPELGTMDAWGEAVVGSGLQAVSDGRPNLPPSAAFTPSNKVQGFSSFFSTGPSSNTNEDYGFGGADATTAAPTATATTVSPWGNQAESYMGQNKYQNY